MKKTLLASIAAVAAFAAVSLFAASDTAATKEVTLVGTGKCAKCSLGTAKECQNAIVVKEGGKEVTYMISKNDIAEKFHKKICEEDKEIKVTGTVKDVGGEKEITASKIELVKS